MTTNSEKYQVTLSPIEHDDPENHARLSLLYQVGKKVGSTSRLTRLREKIVLMTQQTLNASASSVLLCDDEEKELVFEVVAGPAEKSLRRVKLSTQSGIAGWVARNGKPLIINDVQMDQRFEKTIDAVTGFVTKSIICVPMMVHRKVIGVIEVLNKLDGSDFSEHDLEALVSVASTAAMAIENTRLHQTILNAYKSTIKTLAAAIDAKDPYTRGHSQRVMEYALSGGIALSLPAEEMETLEYASILHDIGKITIDARILNKPDNLTSSEWNIMREHSVIGANLLKEISFLEKASKLVLHHHERYDGTGYPDGLKGENIPMGARLIAVADAFDTMTTDRSYRPAMPVEGTISELYDCSGTQFCPIAVEAFVAGFYKDNNRLFSSSTLGTGQPEDKSLTGSFKNLKAQKHSEVRGS
jgi:putative nucleotidyltransferase with HDIG domain